MNMLKVSEEILALVSNPQEVELKCGKPAEIGEMPWVHFEKMWSGLMGIFMSFEGDDGDEKAFMKELEKAPGLIIDIIHYSSGIEKAELKNLPKGDVFQLARAAVRVNFIDNREHLDFFGDFKLLGLGDSESAEAEE